jgi:Lrp/AsnC family transcriptional regulator, leucine-responsive regulatory protein
LDTFDAKILNILQIDTTITIGKIGAQVGLSTSAVQRRIKALRKAKIIEREVAIVAPSIVGRRLTAIVSVSLQRDQVRLLDEFKRQMFAAPEVMQCYYVSGVTDMVVILCVSDMEEYVQFAERHFSGNPNVQQFITHFVMQRVKDTTAIHISADRNGTPSDH